MPNSFLPPLPPVGRPVLEALPPAIPKSQAGAKLPAFVPTSTAAQEKLTSLASSFTTKTEPNRENQNLFVDNNKSTIRLAPISTKDALLTPGKIRPARPIRKSFAFDNYESSLRLSPSSPGRLSKSTSTDSEASTASSLGSELDDL